jgi:hypothetical protein
MRVPELTTPDVTPSPLPTPYNQNRATPEDYGAQLGPGIAEMGSVALDIYKKTKDQGIADRVSKADVDFGNSINDAAWNTKDGFMLQLGQNAIDSKPYLSKLDAARSSIAGSLKDNPDAQRVFNMRAAARLEQARQQAEQHSGQQQKVVGQQSAEAQQKLALDSIGLLRGTPDDVAQGTEHYVGMAKGPLDHHMSAMGLPPDAAEANLKDFESKAYGKALQGFIDAWDGAGARELYENTKDKLGAQAPEYDKLIIRAERRQDGGVLAGQAITQATGAGGWVDLQKAIGILNDKLPDDDERKGPALQALESRAALYNKAAGEKEQQTLGRVWMDIEHHGGLLNEESADYQSLSDEAKGRALEKSKAIQRQLYAEGRRNVADERRDAADALNEQKQTNVSALNTFNGLPLEQRISQDLETSYPGVDKVMGLPQLQAAQERAREAYQKGAGEKLGQVTSVTNAEAVRQGLSKELAKGLNSQMIGWWNDQFAKNKAAPTPEEVNAELARVIPIRKKEVMGISIPFTGQRVFQQEQQQARDASKKSSTNADSTSPQTTGSNGTVKLIGPGGKRGAAPEKGLDQWLSTHKGWSRAQ